jgi:hypothetical protein
VLVFYGLDKEDGEIFRCERYTRERGRQNMWGARRRYVCRVLYYLRVCTHGDDVVRLAVLDAYKPKDPMDGMLVAKGGDLEDSNYATDVSHIDHKLVCIMPNRFDCGDMYFLSYRNMSKSR